ncbi:MAG TPA: aldo/keto reductase [Polyangiaceae bacterium]|jgi:aryl-alcohol dehydrogenase-like predicted oxidoreductase|nr:aldo/keto reductase [Polyangiaceae bacterium]
MDKTPFGSLGWQLTRIGFGTMPLAVQNRPSEDHAVSVIVRALSAGINWLDTADAYCLDDDDIGYGERLVARALREWNRPNDSILVTTKGGFHRAGGEWQIDASPAHLKLACERSLKALGVSSIFLYQLHMPDPKVDYVDSVGALVDLQREGKIQHIGLSNVDVGQIKDAQSAGVIRMVQNRCNLFDPFPFTNGVVDYCLRQNIAFVAHSPLGGHKGHVRADENAAIKAVAERRGLTPHEVVLLWLLGQSPRIFAVPGAKRVESLESNVRAVASYLSAADIEQLSDAFPRDRFLRPLLVRTRNELRRATRIVKRRLARAR